MGSRGVSARITKPFGTYKTFHDGCRRVDAAVTASMWRKVDGTLILEIIEYCVEIIVDTRARYVVMTVSVRKGCL